MRLLLLSKKKPILGATVFSLLLLLGGGWFLLPSTTLTYSSDITPVLKVLDRHGRRIRTVGEGEKFAFVKIGNIPEKTKRLFLLAEDKSFYQHFGIDSLALLRAAVANLKNGRVVSGASTITQQVVRIKNSLPRTFVGKLKVLLGAFATEISYSKKQILEYYLNTVPFGANIRGVSAASDFFFQKSLEELSLAETAVLATLPRAPSLLMRKDARLRLIKARDNLLDRYAEEYGQKNLVELSKKEDLSTYKISESWQAPHFLNFVLSHKETNQFVAKDILLTTLDLDIQGEVKEILKSQVEDLKEYGVSKAASIVIERETGNILAYAGTHDFYEAEGGQYDSVLEKRQPGSAVKPFTYALALEKGRNLSDILSDIPVRFRSGGGTFIPRNYSQEFTGPRLLMDSLSNSLNIPALVLADELGVREVFDFYQSLGFDLEKESDHYGVGITLGNGEMSLYQLTQAYTIFPNGGEQIFLNPFLKAKTKKEKRISPQSAWLISYALDNDVSRRPSFGQRNIFELPHSLSVKTGTSTLFRDNWSIGFNNKYIIGVWVGNMDQKPMKNISGVTGAGPILVKISETLAKNKFIGVKERPIDVHMENVCALSGKKANEHCLHKVSIPVQNKKFSHGLCDQHYLQAVRSCQKQGKVEKVPVYTLPPLYHEWMRLSSYEMPNEQIREQCTNDEFTLIDMISTKKAKVALQSPLDGAIYAIDPNIPGKYQVLKVEALSEGSFDFYEWDINGKILRTKKPFIDYQLEKGKVKISVSLIKNNEKVVSDKVFFNVL